MSGGEGGSAGLCAGDTGGSGREQRWRHHQRRVRGERVQERLHQEPHRG